MHLSTYIVLFNVSLNDISLLIYIHKFGLKHTIMNHILKNLSLLMSEIKKLAPDWFRLFKILII